MIGSRLSIVFMFLIEVVFSLSRLLKVVVIVLVIVVFMCGICSLNNRCFRGWFWDFSTVSCRL